MKQSPDVEKLEQVLRSSRLVAGGFLGSDTRTPEEIIEEDTAKAERLGQSVSHIAARMKEITEQAKRGLGTVVNISGRLECRVTDTRGWIPCPWPHPGKYSKAVTHAKRTDTGESAIWSDLSIHMIGEHGFFEGRGSSFRINPARLIDIIF